MVIFCFGDSALTALFLLPQVDGEVDGVPPKVIKAKEIRLLGARSTVNSGDE
jgi:hypothetical protein